MWWALFWYILGLVSFPFFIFLWFIWGNIEYAYRYRWKDKFGKIRWNWLSYKNWGPKGPLE